MAQYDNAYEYFLGTSAPTASTTYPTPNGPYVTTRLLDTADGTDEGDVTIGTGSAYYTNVSANVTLYGVTAAGHPIIYYPAGNSYYLLSNNDLLSGPIGPITQTGTFTFCFAPGTRIATSNGETAVEDLAIGDQVDTSDGRMVPIKWIGQQTVHKLFSGPNMQPVRIRAGALGDGLPHSDLTVTADHGMVIDGLVINASALVNGSTIDFVPLDELPDQIIYYHIETENHDVIFANGAPAETFIDIPGRKGFDNYQEYLDLYGAERLVLEMDCPRISAQRLLPEPIRERLGIPVDKIAFDQPLTA